MTRILLLIWTACVVTACNLGSETSTSDNSEFQTETSYPNGKPEILLKQLRDTVINGLTFSYKLKRELDTLGQITREGYYIDNQAFGLHKFYQDNKINVIREYILFTPDQIKLLQQIDSLISLPLSSKTTYLNAAYFLHNNDTIADKSSFYKISLRSPNVTNDSLRTHIEFHEPQIDIKAIQLYFDVPDDTSILRIIDRPGNSLEFAQPVSKNGRQTISGFAFLDGSTIDKNTGDTLGASRFMYVHKIFEIK